MKMFQAQKSFTNRGYAKRWSEPPVRPSQHRGFALVLALSLMSLMVLLVVGFSLIGQVESASANARLRETQARQHAMTALREALGELQRHLGQDTRLSATAGLTGSPNDSFWTGAWLSQSPSSAPVWLVSGEASTPGAAAADRRRLAGSGTLSAGNEVTAPAVPVTAENFRGLSGASTLGHYAWWVGDEGVKASLVAGDPLFDANLNAAEAQARRQQTNPAGDVEVFFPGLSSGAAFEQLRSHFPDLTFLSRAVLADTLNGGLRQNLTGGTAQHPLLTPAVWNFLNPNSNEAARWNMQGLQPVLKQFPAPGGTGLADLPEGTIYESAHPLITEFRLSVGIFHTAKAGGGQAAGLMRLRFHVDIEWLNPYPYPLSMAGPGTGGSRRGYYLVFDGLPKLRVRNPNGGSFDFDLNDFQPDLPWNDESRRKLATWAEFTEGRLLPGEVYWMLEPRGQSEGLARTLSNQFWSIGEPKPNKDSWFREEDTITIEPVEDSDTGFNITVYPYVGELEDDEYPDDYGFPDRAGPPILRLLNIPVKMEPTEIDGRDFSRESSTTYTQENYNFAWYFRIFDEDAMALQLLRETIDPRDPVIDFRQLEEAGVLNDIFKVFTDPRQAVQMMDGFSGLGTILTDDTKNSHNPEAATTVLADKVRDEPLSVGVFRHLQTIGLREPFAAAPRVSGAPGNPWNDALDQFFFTGVAEGANFPADAPPPATLFPNPALEPLRRADGTFPPSNGYRQASISRDLLARGAFNLHSVSVPAWDAVLRTTLEDWRFNRAGVQKSLASDAPDATGQPPAAAFFRLPFAAAYATDVYADAAAQNFEDALTRATLGRQGARFLNASQTRALAETIVNQLRAAGRPFSSLRAFAESGLLDAAIAEAGLNPEPLGSQYPVHLDGADLLSALHPRLTARSDTFLLRAYGEVQNPFTGRIEGRAWCEATVQRLPEYIDSTIDADPATAPTAGSVNEAFGRRFRILNLRWLTPDEV
jgi:hypothetical protein